jgi:CO/xanthine dehydrogenase Mo-binding subunit
VTATEVGGGFGGKIYLTELMVAVLAMAVRRPVKYIMSRGEDMRAATPAPLAIVELKTGMKKDGTLTALQSRLIYDSGAFPGAPMLPGCLLVGGYYKCANLEIHGFEVLTNKVSVGALRAPGAHNATFAVESHMDMMAKELGLDPLEVRLKNAVEEGDPPAPSSPSTATARSTSSSARPTSPARTPASPRSRRRCSTSRCLWSASLPATRSRPPTPA